MKAFHSFVLSIPYLFLKKIPYAWVFVIALWAWPPVVSGIFVGIILLGLWFMVMQQKAWEAEIAREYRVLYRDQPHAPVTVQVRNFVLVCVAGALIGWVADGKLGLSSLQWALMLIGVMLLYKDAMLFGAGTVYLVTNKGIAVRYIPGHIDYRLFFGYDEIRNVERIGPVKSLPMAWSVLTPQRKIMENGFLLKPKKLNGFTKTIEEVVLCPADPEGFLKHMPPSISVKEVVTR